MAELKRDMAILATSGRDWADRTKRLAARVPDLNIFSEIERVRGGWRITEDERAVLDFMEVRPITTEMKLEIERRPLLSLRRLTRSPPIEKGWRRHGLRHRRRVPDNRRRTSRS
ncbi:hypothetical protein XH84_32220 [Bradyrhizobium nanningense]|nr:hypothetical protein [Bradyrhizobium nanningense]RXH24763.1 hypothetical protein XH84_32220 [Bradyrhizobium nanningense]